MDKNRKMAKRFARLEARFARNYQVHLMKHMLEENLDDSAFSSEPQARRAERLRVLNAFIKSKALKHPEVAKCIDSQRIAESQLVKVEELSDGNTYAFIKTDSWPSIVAYGSHENGVVSSYASATGKMGFNKAIELTYRS